MTPEDKLRLHLTNTLKCILPKGRYVLQPIETKQIGVPDFYFAYNNKSLWIETKTTDYVVDCFQRNWAAAHQKAGGKTYVLTRIPTLPAYLRLPHPTIPNQWHTPTCSSSSSSLYLLPFDDKMLDHSTLGIYIKAERPSMTALEDFLDTLR